MHFASDNCSGAHPDILSALSVANDGFLPSYGVEPLMDEVRARLREIFEAPEAAIYLVATGTAANSLILGTLAAPYDTIFCTAMAHINEDEANAPEFYTGGAKLTLVPDEHAKMTPPALRTAVEAHGTRGVHGPRRGPVSLTSVTEKGTIYTAAEIAAICEVARDYGLKVHLDGARLANALAATGASAASATWRAGVDAVSLGASKNGCLGVEAVILFDPARAEEFEWRRKRGGHLFSKHRYLSTQMAAWLRGDLWLRLAGEANAAAARLTDGLRRHPDVRFCHEPEANMIFAEWPRGLHRRLHAAGAEYYLYSGGEDGPEDEPQIARLVTSWNTPPGDIDRFLAVLDG